MVIGYGVVVYCMKARIVSLLLFISTVCAHAQNEVLTIKNDSVNVHLESLDISIQVIGNVATTVTKMTFFNPNDRVLEGELDFPLAEGQSVFRFAMDVNGKQREGVVVEKTLGRKAFEGVVRQAIDPGLLEKTVGNNYKTRVYPIPAKGRKIVLIGYQEELKGGKVPFYQLVANYGIVKEFELNIEVVNQEMEPKVKTNELANVTFQKWRQSHLAELKKENLNVTGVFSFEVPSDIEERVFRQQSTEDDFFYITTFPKVVKASKETPSSLAILWDASGSLAGRDTAREFKLLRDYIKKLSQINVDVIVFSNAITEERHFQITDGNSDQLIKMLSETVYDGGTGYEALRLKSLEHSQILFFSDGISNLDKIGDIQNQQPIYVITSSKSADSEFGKYLSQTTGGSFVNLLNTSDAQALQILTTVEYQFLGATFDKRRVTEVYPMGPVNITEGKTFSIAGRIKSKKGVRITLNFGMQGRILDRRKITIPGAVQGGVLDRLWATKKAENLLQNTNHDQQAIINLGKTYGLVTPYTSLIVLDRVEDYLQYEIVPPTELRAKYDHLISEKKEETKSSRYEIIELALEDFEERKFWWMTDEKDTVVYKPKPDDTNDNNRSERTEQQTDSADDNIDEVLNQPSQPQRTAEPQLNQPGIDTTVFNKLIEGQVFDESGETLPGVNVIIKGTAMGTTTDIDGAYKIRTRSNDILVISFIGLTSDEFSVMDITDGDITLENDVTELNEVVVTAQGIQREVRSLSYAVSSVSSHLQGRVPGVRTQSSHGSIVVRGFSSLQASSESLFIVDGEMADANEVNSLSPDDIASMNIIQEAAAVSIYGEMARGGVVVIMTNYGLEDETQLPDSITSAFDQDFVINDWKPDEAYLDTLINTPQEKQFEVYLKLKEEYNRTPSFYLIVGNFFIENGQVDIGTRILSNIAELSLEDHELLKTLAKRYYQLEKFETSLYLFNKVLELRPDEPQSKRDLALVHQAMGQYQQALNLFNEIIVSDWNDFDERFPLIKSTIIHEMNNLIALHKADLDLSDISKDLVVDMPVDIRVVLEWNNLETDLDLWVTDPNGEKCSYKNLLTKIGGRLTEDFMDGYGPEEYLLKKGVKGEYKIEVDYYDERVQKVSGPVTLQISIFTNYGSKDQKVKRLTRELKGVEDTIEIGRFNWVN